MIALVVAIGNIELWADWTQTMEAKDHVFDKYLNASLVTSWQSFWRHVRGQYPFAVYESALANSVHKFRADGASFKPKPAAGVDYDGLWNLPFATRHLGYL